MNTHEYQAKTILRHYGVPLQPFYVASTMSDIEKAIKALQDKPAVLKVQIHAGGRGKAGGVRRAKDSQEIREHAKEMLGMRIVNNQTGPGGIIANQLIISPLQDFEKEYYISVVIDRQRAQTALIASPEGGMEIEEVAHKSPEKILTLMVPTDGKLKQYQLLRFVKFMGWEGATAAQGKTIAQALVTAFLESDASLLEINPLVKTREGELIALDAKLSIDENALYRHADLAALFDPTQLPSSEVEAKNHDLAYIALNGNIGCMVNGAGLAMATMDIIQYAGGSPANFLDVGGSASEEKIAAGFKILMDDPQVQAILVNIFGGIMNCETLAHGIMHAIQDNPLTKPLVVRMEGTNVDKGREILAKSGLPIIVAKDLTEAAEKAVAAAKTGGNHAHLS